MSTFVASLHEVFEHFGRIETKRMFGGHGIYHEGRMFALVTNDVLYLKADAESAPEFDRLQLGAFEFAKSGKTMKTSYRAAPVEVFEDRSEAARWARRAYEAALRSGLARKQKKPPKPRRAAAR